MRVTTATSALLLASVLALTPACAPRQLPPDYRPDPMLLSRIESISIKTPPFVCPGQNLKAAYEAKLEDGTVYPFVVDYDEDNPPPLHISFLSRTSQEAIPRDDGSWDALPDPLRGATTGYRLNAVLSHKSSVYAEHVVEPEYSCLPHEFRFKGDTGQPGKRVVVRLDILSSPFFEHLLVAEISVSGARPFHVLADAKNLPRTDWLVIESHGGPGAPGIAGRDGAPGRDGATGCPGTSGGSGGNGRSGGRGGAGGTGGEIFLIVPTGETRLAWLAKASAPGGIGGAGGMGGSGGEGGSGGSPSADGCAGGNSGRSGNPGKTGVRGAQGQDGPPTQAIEFPRERVFQANGPVALKALIEYSRNRTIAGGMER